MIITGDILYYNGLPLKTRNTDLKKLLGTRELLMGETIKVLYSGIDSESRTFSYVCRLRSKSVWIEESDVYRYFFTLRELRSYKINLLL